MRILLADHFPLQVGAVRSPLAELAQGLVAAGHEVQALVVGRGEQQDVGFPVHQVECREGDIDADLPFEPPQWESGPACSGFSALSDQQLSDYRQALRHWIDLLVERFNPDIIHVEHVWLGAQLALETGAPYVIMARAEELAEYESDVRCRQLAAQAAENAGRIFVADSGLQARVLETFEHVEPQTVVVLPQDKTALPLIVEHYGRVLAERFGRL